MLTLALTPITQFYMFDFEKLTVYQKAKQARKQLFSCIKDKHGIDKFLSDQIRRSALSIILNIAEGTGKSSKADKKNYFTVARGSTYETAAIIDTLKDDGFIEDDEYNNLYLIYEEISKMLLGLMNSLK